jgi:hypothetical protein
MAAARRRRFALGPMSFQLVAALERWMRTERSRVSRHAEIAQAIDHHWMLTHAVPY